MQEQEQENIGVIRPASPDPRKNGVYWGYEMVESDAMEASVPPPAQDGPTQEVDSATQENIRDIQDLLKERPGSSE